MWNVLCKAVEGAANFVGDVVLTAGSTMINGAGIGYANDTIRNFDRIMNDTEQYPVESERYEAAFELLREGVPFYKGNVVAWNCSKLEEGAIVRPDNCGQSNEFKTQIISHCEELVGSM